MSSPFTPTRLARVVAGALIALAVAGPAAASAQTDLRMPDTRDAAAAIERPVVDLRMPDTRDAANNPRYVSDLPAGSADAAGSSGFDWSTAGISVAALAGLLIVAAAALSALRRSSKRPAAP